MNSKLYFTSKNSSSLYGMYVSLQKVFKLYVQERVNVIYYADKTMLDILFNRNTSSFEFMLEAPIEVKNEQDLPMYGIYSLQLTIEGVLDLDIEKVKKEAESNTISLDIDHT